MKFTFNEPTFILEDCILKVTLYYFVDGVDFQLNISFNINEEEYNLDTIKQKLMLRHLEGI